MTRRNGEPPILPGCTVLPPMEDDRPKRLDADDQANGDRKPNRPKTRNRFAVLNGFIDFTMRDLKAADVRVWFVLYRDTQDGTAATAQTDIAARAGLSVRAVKDSIRRLQDFGLLKVVYRGGLRRGTSRYRVLPFAKDRQRTK